MDDFGGSVRRVVLAPIEGATAGAFGRGSITVRLRSEDTAGRLGLVEQVIPPNDPGPGMHVHPGFDETFYVIEGTVAFRLGDHACNAGSGTVAFVPRGTPHTFANPSGQFARVLVLVTPGGFERYFDELIVSIQARGGVPPDRELTALRIAHGSLPA